MNDELWGVGKTFMLAILMIIAPTVLLALNKIPVDVWSTMCAVGMGGYSLKSGLSKIGNKKGNGQT